LAYVYAVADAHTNTSADAYAMAYVYAIPDADTYSCRYADCCTDTDA
jgi:hypothetical protein